MLQKNPDEIADLINAYFSVNNSPDLNFFKTGIEECIKDFQNSGKIYNHKSLDALTKEFDDSEIPDVPVTLEKYLDFIREKFIPNIVNVCKPGYLGHMTSCLPAFFQYISQMLTVLNQNVVKTETSMAATLIERQVITMLHRLVFELSDEFYKNGIHDKDVNMGLLLSGGTLANITALWIARNKLQKEQAENGSANKSDKKPVIICSVLMHYSMDKLSSLLGIGKDNIIKIGLDADGKININEVENIICQCKKDKRPIIALIGIAGTTETGKIDDLYAMGQIAGKYKIHFHVDAAWGGPILFSDKYKHLLKGIEKADTVIICGHKQLYLPMGVSVLLCKNTEQIELIKFTSNYQARVGSYDLGQHSPEGSRPARCLLLHAGLHLLGKEGYSYLIDKGIEKTAFLTSLIKNNQTFELIEEPQTNIVIYRYIPAQLREKAVRGQLTSEENALINCINEVLQEEQFQRGKTFISRTTLRLAKYNNEAIVVLRAVLLNPLTTQEKLQELLLDQEEVGEIILKEKSFLFADALDLLKS